MLGKRCRSKERREKCSADRPVLNFGCIPSAAKPGHVSLDGDGTHSCHLRVLMERYAAFTGVSRYILNLSPSYEDVNTTIKAEQQMISSMISECLSSLQYLAVEGYPCCQTFGFSASPFVSKEQSLPTWPLKRRRTTPSPSQNEPTSLPVKLNSPDSLSRLRLARPRQHGQVSRH